VENMRLLYVAVLLPLVALAQKELASSVRGVKEAVPKEGRRLRQTKEFTKSRPAPTPQRPVAVRPPKANNSTTTESFTLKLYWEEGYFWQQEDFERRWCMQCVNNCTIGGSIQIVNCDNDGKHGFPNRFSFLPNANVNANKEVFVQEASSGLCMERTSGAWKITLQSCKPDVPRQIFIVDKGSLVLGDRFQLRPKGHLNSCVTQDHHPKYAEIVEIQSCAYAVFSETAYWTLLA
jgi:hypothetical protein